MKLKRFRICLAVILLLASMIPIIDATFITIYPVDSNDDAYITGAGNYFGDTPFLPLRSSVTNFVIGTRFRNVAIPQGSKINNATLRVKSTYAYPIAGDIRVTITGDDADDSLAFNDSGSFSRTYTLAYVVWNISEVNGNTWATVDVTEIVQEVVDRVGWVSGNSLSLVYFTDKGSPRREFSSLDNNVGYKARIEIFYGVAPTPEEDEEIADQAEPPFNDTDEYVWEKNDTYRGIDIYIVTQYGDPMFQTYSIEHTSFNAWYFNVTNGIGSEIEWDSGAMSFALGGCATTKIMGIDPYTIIFADPGDVAVYVSDDEMATSTHYHPNDAYDNLQIYGGNGGSMAIDPDGVTIHLVYTSVTPGQDAVYNVVYTNFTIDMITGIPTFADTYTNLTQVADTQNDPVIYVQPNGTLHVAWSGEQGTDTDQIWYRRRLANGTWLSQVRVSDTDVALDYNRNPDVVANDETGDALIVWTYDVSNVHWDFVFPNNTVSPADRDMGAGRYPSMVNDRLTNTANIAYQVGSSGVIYFNNMTITNSSTWNGAIQISPAAEKHKYPDIGINPVNRSLTIVWYNDWNEYTAGNWWKIGQTPTPKKTQLTNARLLYNFIEEIVDAVFVDSWIFLVYPNGTLTNGPLDPGEDPKDVIDELLGGAQPEDPLEDEYPVISRFRWKLLVLAVGLIMMLGSPIAGILYGADTATWIKLLFVAFFGLGILWQIKFM